jgi:hypothetical protein
MCTLVYTSHQHYYSSLLSTHLPFFLAGWLTPTHHVGYMKEQKKMKAEGKEEVTEVRDRRTKINWGEPE